MRIGKTLSRRSARKISRCICAKSRLVAANTRVSSATSASSPVIFRAKKVSWIIGDSSAGATVALYPEEDTSRLRCQ
jgi:hypothetical protein